MGIKALKMTAKLKLKKKFFAAIIKNLWQEAFATHVDFTSF